MRTIDAHAHVADSIALTALLDELDMKVLSICVAEDPITWREDAERYKAAAQRTPRRYAWCTTFDSPDFGDRDYADKVIARMKEDFTEGAIAVKIWKHIGMEFKDPDGNFLQMDHPIFDPIYDFLAKESKPLISHAGEPKGCWMPLGPDNPHDEYYGANPEWHMYGKQGYPSHEQIMAARDRVVARYPGMPFIGAHMASLERDLKGLAERLDTFANLAVDASRTWDMTYLDPDEVREFYVKYSDRLMFATDVMCSNDLDDQDPEKQAEETSGLRRRWQMERRFCEDQGAMDFNSRQVRCLNLPATALENIYTATAQRWLPGL